MRANVLSREFLDVVPSRKVCHTLFVANRLRPPVTISISPALLAALDSLARRNRTSRSQAIEALAWQALSKLERDGRKKLKLKVKSREQAA